MSNRLYQIRYLIFDICLTVCFRYPDFESIVEVSFRQQPLHGDMHSISPVVLRVGGFVDLLLCRLLSSEFAGRGYPVLPGKDAEHRRGIEMQFHYLFAQPWFGEVRSTSVFTQHGVEEALRAVVVAFPPCPDAAHVVGGGGAH